MKIAHILLCLNFTLAAYAQMTDNYIENWFTEQIKQQKLAPIRFYGRHNEFDGRTLTTRELLDFDFQAESSGFIDLEIIEIKSSDVVDTITLVHGGLEVEAGEEELVQQAIEKLQSIATPSDRYAVSHC
jgi:hypothetical protein